MANLSNLNNKFLVTTTGEVLIGQTSNNGNRLQITGADGASYIYLKTDVATTGGRIGFNGDDLRVFNQQAAGELHLGTAGSTKMTIDTAGNVGIGITPSTIWSSSYNALQIGLGGSVYAHSSAGSSLNLGANIVYEGTAPNYYDKYLTSSTATKYQQDAGIHIWSTAVSGTAGNPVSWSERMRITSGGTVQIGTTLNTSPTDTGLCVSNRKSIRINDADGNYNFGVYIKQNYSVNSYLILGTRHNAIDTDGLVVKSGNVGIGTDSPQQPLHVQSTGDLFTRYQANSNANGVQFQTWHGNSQTMTINSNTTNPFAVYVGSASGTIAINVASNANVGIGTTSPGAKLEVTTSTAGFGGIIQNTNDASDANGLLIKAGTVSSEYSLKVSNSTDSSNFMVVKGNGRVGIGTTSPSQKLHVVGKSLFTDDIQLTQTSPRIDYGNTTVGALRFFSVYENSVKMALYDGGRLHPTGGVFLGSSNNDQLLDYYKESTWTPVIQDLSGNQATLSAQSGTYTKIGRQVFLNYRVQLSSKASMTGSYVLLGGLPFNHPTGTNGSGTIDYFQNMATGFSSLAWDTTSTGTVCWLVGVLGTSSTGSVYVTPAQITDTTVLKGTIIYMAVT